MFRSLLLCLALVAAPQLRAEDYPTKPIAVIVPAAPGGATDVLARLVAQSMSVTLGQNLIIENIAGAGGTTGMARAAKAAPDGYTLGFGNMGHLAANVALYPKLGFDPRKDFEPLGVVADVPMVLAVSNKSGIRTLADYLAYMRAKPGALNIGTSGPGSTGHLAPTLLMKLADAKATLVTYRGAAPAITDLMSGTIDSVFDQTVTMIPLHEAKSAYAVAISSQSRIVQLPDVPTFAEAGLPAFDMVVWQGFVVPTGTPKPVLDKLGAALARALEDPEVLKRFAILAATAPAPSDRGAEPMRRRIASDVARWIDVLGVPAAN
ncbi:tripartite tricarboxylate transporter substrate binding protein [Bosea sp. 124]|uniref:Bug family tripartite tricarboxylate transporter substrate binding protein n=1 Tax=Bosea sp. 124 TaxID=2135642 RepID=UPI000D3476CA|nr:tripartite tricarboxylate transporter substrate binding protein [Bosea sp. 124]PTM39112.1 tripartite-type tricarboxylate transporter receptor subunit TctC [Bosea sp. 124]